MVNFFYFFFKLYNNKTVAPWLVLTNDQLEDMIIEDVTMNNTLLAASCVLFLFLLHFDITCNLLPNRHMATWNLFVNPLTP